MVSLASHKKIFSGCCSRHESTHPLTFILNRLITSAAVCCAVQAECVHSLGVTAAIVSLCSQGFCTWMSVVLATIAGSFILIHSNSMQKGFVCTTSAVFNTNFLPKGFQGIIKTVLFTVSPSFWCPAVTPLSLYLSFSDWPYTFQSCNFSLFSTFLFYLTRAIWTSSSDNTNSTCSPPQHHTDWYSAQLLWISPSICSNQSYSASLPLRVCRGVAEIYLGMDMRFTVEIKTFGYDCNLGSLKRERMLRRFDNPRLNGRTQYWYTSSPKTEPRVLPVIRKDGYVEVCVLEIYCVVQNAKI